MLKAVTDGALLQCTQGSMPCKLTATNHRNVQIDDKPMATVMDHVPGMNIATFGDCKATGSACAPATPGPWFPGSERLVQVNDQLVLMRSDTLACSVSGVISIVQVGQSRNVRDA